MTPSPFIQRLHAQDRAASYIVAALFVPLAIFTGVGVAVMLGSPPELDVALALFPALFWSFMALTGLSLTFRAYCWFSFNRELRS